MRLISCSMTEPQIRDGIKSETRRLGWAHAREGHRLIFIRKGQGLKPGELVVPVRPVELTKVWWERVDEITDDGVVREGFPEMVNPMVPGEGAQRFVSMFCRAMACRPDRVIRVLRFRYLSIDDLTKKQRDQWLRLVERAKEVEQ